MTLEASKKWQDSVIAGNYNDIKITQNIKNDWIFHYDDISFLVVKPTSTILGDLFVERIGNI